MRIITSVILALLVLQSSHSWAFGFSDADAQALTGRLVRALNTRDAALLRSIYHQDLRMTVCNGFERLVGHVVFGDGSDITFENLKVSSASLTMDPKIIGVAPSSRIPVIFGMRWTFESADADGPSCEIVIAIRWEVGSVGGSWKVMRQYSEPCEIPWAPR